MTTFQTILMLLLMAGLIVCHEAISKERHLTDKNVLRTLRKIGATILETYSDGLVIFQMEDVSFWLYIKNKPVLTLGATAAICTKEPNMDAAEKAMDEMNNITSGVYIMIDKDNKINYLCNFFAPSCHVLKKTLPLVAEHIDKANTAFEETYLEKTDQNN